MQDRESHGKTIEQLVADFETHLEQGLTQREAPRPPREAVAATNLVSAPAPGFLSLLWDQFNNYLVIILIIAALVSLALGRIRRFDRHHDHRRAERGGRCHPGVQGGAGTGGTRRRWPPRRRRSSATAIRSRFPAGEIVTGDIVLLEAGNYVPADVRLFESFNLKVEEASLTGESVPVDKDPAAVLDQEIPLGDRKNTAFMGTARHLRARQGPRCRHGDEHADRPHRGDDPVASRTKLRRCRRNSSTSARCSAPHASRSAPSSSSMASSAIRTSPTCVERSACSTICRPSARTSSTSS